MGHPRRLQGAAELRRRHLRPARRPGRQQPQPDPDPRPCTCPVLGGMTDVPLLVAPLAGISDQPAGLQVHLRHQRLHPQALPLRPAIRPAIRRYQGREVSLQRGSPTSRSTPGLPGQRRAVRSACRWVSPTRQ
ncbi:hypothetical protein ACPA9J_08535 [Pseudomonas aeruginosa]